MPSCTICSLPRQWPEKAAPKMERLSNTAYGVIAVYFNRFSEINPPVELKIACQRSAPNQNFTL